MSYWNNNNIQFVRVLAALGDRLAIQLHSDSQVDKAVLANLAGMKVEDLDEILVRANSEWIKVKTDSLAEWENVKIDNVSE